MRLIRFQVSQPAEEILDLKRPHLEVMTAYGIEDLLLQGLLFAEFLLFFRAILLKVQTLIERIDVLLALLFRLLESLHRLVCQRRMHVYEQPYICRIPLR